MNARFAILLALFLSVTAVAQEAFTSPQARSAETRYRNAQRRATEDYIRELKAAQETAIRDRQIEEAARIKVAIEAAENEVAMQRAASRGQLVTVSAKHGPRNAFASGVTVKAGQKYRLLPNPDDTWKGIGEDPNAFCNYMGYQSHLGKQHYWMRLHCQVGNGQAFSVIAGEEQVAPVSGELLFFGMDTATADNVGQVRVVVIVE